MNARRRAGARILAAGVTMVAAAVVLTSGRAATTAATVRVEVFPERPRAGDVTTVQLRPFWLLVDGGGPPALLPDYPWRMAAVSPSGRIFRIRMVQAPTDPYLWSGTIRFSSPGSWELCVLNFSPGRACIRRSPGWRRVRVRERGASVDVWHGLQRPLRIPTIAADSPCPTTAPGSEGDLTRFGSTGPAWGSGPAYPAGLDSREGKPILRYLDPIPPASSFYGSEWFGEKVLWVVDPAYRGPALVRGRQLDGPDALRFDRRRVPSREMRISPSLAPRGRPSYTRVRAAGCYGYQVDGSGFSYVIVFEARPY